MQPPDPGPSGARPGVEPPSRKTVVVDELPTGPHVLGGELEPGRGLELVGKAGEGAMGEVLVATDRDLNRTVAFKVMSHQLAASPRQAARFYAEAQITAQLDHPGIVLSMGSGAATTAGSATP
jgi:hypothetical protein